MHSALNVKRELEDHSNVILMKGQRSIGMHMYSGIGWPRSRGLVKRNYYTDTPMYSGVKMVPCLLYW